MKYVRVRRDPLAIVAGPGPLPKVWGNLSGFDKLSPAELARHHWYAFAPDPEPAASRYEKVSQRLELDGTTLRVRYDVRDMTDAERIHQLAEARRAVLAKLPGIRYLQETRGIEHEGIPLHTDRESQAAIALAAMQGTTERWKGSDGKWYDLDAETLQAAAQAVVEHKRACFSREEALTKEVWAADSLEALEAIDINEGWP